jgi:hypothetical protein
MRKLRRQGRDVDASELGGRANGAIAVPDREDVMSSDPLAEIAPRSIKHSTTSLRIAAAIRAPPQSNCWRS